MKRVTDDLEHDFKEEIAVSTLTIPEYIGLTIFRH